MKAICKFHWDCGRGGDVEGLFIAEKADVDALIGKEVYFGEILGKHSEVYGTIEEGEITIVTTDQDFIAKFEEIFKPRNGVISGYDPFDYLKEEGEFEDPFEATEGPAIDD